MMLTVSLALAAVGIIFAAFVKGVTGLGFPVIAVPVVAQFLDPQTTVVAISIPTFLMNIIQVIQGDASLATVRRFLPLMVCAIPASIIGTAILATASGALITGILGIIVTVYTTLSLLRVRLVIPPARERQIGVIVGLCSGLMGGATGMFSPPLIIYMTALQLPKATFVSAISLCFIAGQVPQLVSLLRYQLMTGPRLSMAALCCLVGAGGFLAGMRLQHAISQQLFAKVVLVVLLLVGLNLLRVGLRAAW
jgi:uncharacterized membrane protein YfcA